jgi:hypothetical protein
MIEISSVFSMSWDLSALEVERTELYKFSLCFSTVVDGVVSMSWKLLCD